MTETVSFNFAGRGVRVDLGEAVLRPGPGIHQLQMDIKTQGMWLDRDTQEAATVLLHGFVSLADAMRPVAVLPTRVFSLRGWPCDESLSWLLSDEQLIAIDVARGADSVNFRLDLEATLLAQPPSIHPTLTSQVGYRISPGRWLELLDSVGAAVGVTLRVPSPLSDAVPRMSGDADTDASLVLAARRLREARQALREGRYELCVQTCRRILENVAVLAAVPGPAEVAGVVPTQRAQALRWAAVHHAIYSLTSGANHDDEVTKDFSWSQHDAEAALVMVASLLARVRPA